MRTRRGRCRPPPAGRSIRLGRVSAGRARGQRSPGAGDSRQGMAVSASGLFAGPFPVVISSHLRHPRAVWCLQPCRAASAGAAARRPGWAGRSSLRGHLRGPGRARCRRRGHWARTRRCARSWQVSQGGPGRMDRPARRAGQAAGQGHGRVRLSSCTGPWRPRTEWKRARRGAAGFQPSVVGSERPPGRSPCCRWPGWERQIAAPVAQSRQPRQLTRQSPAIAGWLAAL